MRKRTRHRKGKPRGAANRRHAFSLAVSLIIIFAVAGVAGSWGFYSSRKIPARRLLSSPPASFPAPDNPSKEYIYVGGRLIATEEPALTLMAPANLVANSISDIRIDISWAGTPNAHHYQIERATNLNVPFTLLASNVTGTTFSDTSVSSVNAYLYRVMAADAAGNLSAASNVDMGTAIKFDDDPLLPLSEVRAQHILQLRQAVNAVRFAANLPAASWFQKDIQQRNTIVMAVDIQELRTALDEALQRLGLPSGGYQDSALGGVLIQKAHIQQLRDRVK